MSTDVRRVSNAIVCLRRASYQTCSYIVRTPRGIVLVDAGMSSSGADVVAGLEHLDAAPTDVRAILLTHWHNDHAAGARAAHNLSGAPVHYHQADERFFTGAAGARGVRGWVSDLIPEWGVLVLAKGLIGEATPRAVPAQQFVRDGDTLLDDFDVLETPGHTSGHVSYLYRPERALFAGDALAVINRELRPHYVSPGHREPLEAAEAACDAMLRRLAAGNPWPLLG